MKQWMIWSGAGIIGILLAGVAIWFAAPSVTSVEPLPDLPTESRATPDPRPTTVATPSQSEPDEEPDTSEPEPDNRTASAAPPPPVADDGDPRTPEERKLDLREARQELLSRPDMVAVRVLGSRLRGIKRVVSEMDHDPAADHTMNRLDILQRDMRTYRRDPEAFDFDELLARQDHVIGELRQTSYWGDELQDLTASMDQAKQEYFAAGQ